MVLEMFNRECLLLRNFKVYFLTVLFFCVCFTGNLFAQMDTLKIMSTSGEQGDIVELDVELYNHSIDVRSFALFMAYDPNVMTALGIETAERTAYLGESPNVWAAVWDPDVANIDPGQLRLIAFDGYGEEVLWIPRGRGPICTIRLQIHSGAPDVVSSVFFLEIEDNDNIISDTSGTILVVPFLITGSVTIGSSFNNPPEFDASNPFSSYNGTAGSPLQFTVTATDINNDLLHLWAENVPSGATFAGGDGNGSVSAPFSWTPTSNGAYTVTFNVDDSFNSTVSKQVTINVGSGGNPNAPVITCQTNHEATEGDHLEFTVSATDPQGDNITLSANGLPENAEFEPVSGSSPVIGTFVFDPDFNQGGNVYSVTFTASDGSNNSSKLVSITVVEAPNDILEVADGQGALPGSVGRSLIINFRNSEPRYGLQFDLIYDPEILDINNVLADSARVFNLFMQARLLEDGYYRILIFTTNPEEEFIPMGSGRIVEFEVDVDNYALPGLSVVTFDSAFSVIDYYGSQQDIIYSSDEGFGIDILGDANLDGIISIGDCVAIISDILEIIEFDIRKADAADYNRENGVTIADLMEIVNRIFRITPPPPGAYDLAGNVEILRDGIFPGFRGEAPIWLSLDTEAAGVQFTIEYDPSEVIINDVIAGDMVSNLQFDFNDTGEEIKVVVYNFDRSEFGPAVGELAKLDIEFIGENTNPNRAIRLTDFEIVDVNAYCLNVEVLGELPESFILYQNYPNPFNANTVISFEMPYNSNVSIDIFNILGQEVKELYTGQLEAGPHQVIWDGTNSNNQTVTSGIYFYRFQTDVFNKTKKMLLVK